MLALDLGSVYSSAGLALKENSQKPFLQFFKNETISDTVGVALDIKNMNNAGVTIIEDCTFFNNIGTTGASINMDEGGTLIGLANHFSLDPNNLEMPESVFALILKK